MRLRKRPTRNELLAENELLKERLKTRAQLALEARDSKAPPAVTGRWWRAKATVPFHVGREFGRVMRGDIYVFSEPVEAVLLEANVIEQVHPHQLDEGIFPIDVHAQVAEGA